MKTKLTIIAIVTIVVSACTTGTRLTKTYEDDIYFSPADVPPVVVAAEQSKQNVKSNNFGAKDKKMVMSQIERNTDGSATVNNYIYQQDKNANESDVQSYDMNNQELVDSDTTRYYNDDDVKTVINNYYDSDDLGYAYRIRRFHNPYFFSSYFDDWYYSDLYYPGFYSWGMGWNYGWGNYSPWYSWGWGYPYYGYYSPFAYGLGYWGYSGWNNWWYDGYYSNSGWGSGSYYRNQDVARRRDTNLSLPGGAGRNYNGSISGINSGRRPSSTVGDNEMKNATIVNDRRGSTSVNGRRLSNSPGREISNQMQQNVAAGSIRRAYEPSTTGRTYDQNGYVRQNYSPSYNRPRVVNQSNYNSNNYSRSRTSATYDRSNVRSSSSGYQYTEPRSSSNMRQTYRSSSSYSSGSSTSGYSRSSSVDNGSRSSNYTPSPNYSSPSRGSYSGGSGGGSYSGGSSGGSSGGGGGSGHRR